MAMPLTIIAAGIAVQVAADVAGPLAAWRLWRALRAARHAATHDPLTGLPNRRAFLTHLHTALTDDQSVSVAILDLDSFKAVNDRYGHPVGDQVLATVADRLATLSGPVRLAARLGGDEFALILHAQPATALAAARAARAAVCRSLIPVDGHALSVSISVGVAHRRTGLIGTQLLHHADQAIYAAKRHGCGVHTDTPGPSH